MIATAHVLLWEHDLTNECEQRTCAHFLINHKQQPTAWIELLLSMIQVAGNA